MKIKLLLIIPTLDRSGAEKQCVLLATHLPKEEFDVHIAVLTHGGPLAEELDRAGIPYTIIGKPWKLDPVAYLRLKGLIRYFRPDIVHTWLFAANAYGRRAALACGVPCILAGERCVDPWKSELQLRIDRQLAKRSDRIVTNSRGVVDFYARRGIPSELFTVIPNAVLPPKPVFSSLEQQEAARRDLVAQLAVRPYQQEEPYFPVITPDFVPPERPFLIGIVARLWKQKRIDELIWVFEALQFTGVNFHALVIGDGPERELLLRQRDERFLFDCVHFLGHRNDVPRIMPHFDLLVCPSAYEGQSNAILEAMACGIPVVASDIPGNDELVVDRRDLPDAPNDPAVMVPGETGILIPECGDDYRKRRTLFVKEILRLYELPERRKAMGEAAKRRVLEEFTLEKMIDAHVRLYRESFDTCRTACGNTRRKPEKQAIS